LIYNQIARNAGLFLFENKIMLSVTGVEGKAVTVELVTARKQRNQ
jgi:hypothetical protein